MLNANLVNMNSLSGVITTKSNKNLLNSLLPSIDDNNGYKSTMTANSSDVSDASLLTNAPFLRKVLDCIERHVSNDTFGVKTMCLDIGISERQLQRRLKNLTNMSPNQWITYIRMCKAKKLIETNRYNIAQVAFQTGFTSPSYFSKRFKETFGISPSDIQTLPVSK